ncbi:MAG: hypothetical protein ACXVCE_03750 [Bacteriovorax sp.]
MKTSIIITLLFCSLSNSASAMGSKRPSTGGGNTSPGGATPPPPTPPARPTIDLGPDLGPEAYLNASSIVGSSVDLYKKQNELSKIRTKVNDDDMDQCFSDNQAHDQFANQISYYSQMMFKDVPAMVGMIGSYYGTSESDAGYFPTSLIRHPLCNVSASTLSKTINKVPSQKVIDKVNEFANTVNALREETLKGDIKAKEELLTTWSRLFSCLAYTESLGSADSSTSQSVARKYAPANYRKPAGVEFYEDPAQSAESKLNIGTFQFTPNGLGNIAPCLKAWNSMHSNRSTCQIPLKGSTGDLIKALGSSYQSFNAFCGVHKLIQTFAVQVNTSKASATHPSNIVNGKLKNAEARCVSPHFQAGRAYNHFGPFQNSTGSNMDALFTCIQRSQN